MITKETARQIYNCHQQLEEIAKIKEDMLNKVERVRENEKKGNTPIPEKGCSFGKYGKGMQLGVPDGLHCSMRIFNISPEVAVQVMDEQEQVLKGRLKELEAIAKIEIAL